MGGRRFHLLLSKRLHLLPPFLFNEPSTELTATLIQPFNRKRIPDLVPGPGKLLPVLHFQSFNPSRSGLNADLNAAPDPKT
jgi:hypothetical protein